MTRSEQVAICKACQHKHFDINQGIICGLTIQKPEFEQACESFTMAPMPSVPLAKPDSPIDSPRLEVAGTGIRFINYLLDRIVIYLFAVLFGFALSLILSMLNSEALTLFEQENLLMDYVLGFLIILTYYAVMESVTGRTPAKLITRTRVVTEDGSTPSFKMILIRSLCRFIPFEAFSFLGSDAIGWHDSISKTRVVVVKKQKNTAASQPTSSDS